MLPKFTEKSAKENANESVFPSTTVISNEMKLFKGTVIKVIKTFV